MAHTPGPWTLQDVVPGDDWRKPGEYGAKDFALVGPDLVCPGIVWEHGDVGKANARLIAAAPELLEAAKMVAAHLDARINEAPDNAKPVFVGLASLLAAINKAAGAASAHREYVGSKS